jgi:hypothetical protein
MWVSLLFGFKTARYCHNYFRIEQEKQAGSGIIHRKYEGEENG